MRRECILAAVILSLFVGVGGDAGAGEDRAANGEPNAARQEPWEKLTQARTALRGEPKDPALARKILTELVEGRASELSPVELCYAYVYLGYIEDRAKNRQAALAWYRKAVKLEGRQGEGIRRVAELGMLQPITWIRHLDEATSPLGRPAPKPKVLQRIDGGYVTSDYAHGSLSPKMELSAAERLANFDVLWEAVDRHFSFFEHKKIDWQEVQTRYRPKAVTAETADDYYRLLDQVVRELKDCHSWLCNYRQGLQLPRCSPALSIRRIEGKAVVTGVSEDSEAYAKGLRRGSIITHVDGRSVPDQVAKLRAQLPMSSSERNFLAGAYRRLLDGAAGSKVRVTFLTGPKDPPVETELQRGQHAMPRPDEPGFPLEKGRFIWSGVHGSGFGYIRILSFNGRMEIADEFDRALEKLKDTPGLILDIRDNLGGFGTAQARIVGRFITAREKVAVGFRRDGPAHDDFQQRPSYFGPAGPWQYTKPIALLTNAMTGSAADLFACYLTSTGRPITVGSTTHGNLTGVGVYAVLPCKLVVRVSNGYVCNAAGRIIEGNGSEPQVHAEPTIEDVLRGTDSVLDRAVQCLQHAGLGAGSEKEAG